MLKVQMEFKYSDHISKLDSCPPKSCESKNIIGYRFVFEDLACENNYIPPLKITPERVNDPKFLLDKRRCSGYALSMFNDIEKARLMHIKLSGSFRKFRENTGTHIAEFSILETDGLVSQPDGNGHFDLHEFKKTDLRGRVKLICRAQ